MPRPIAYGCRPWTILLILLAAPTMSLAQEVPAAARTCKVGAYIMALHSIDFEGNTFGADLWIWSLCLVEDGDLKPIETPDYINSMRLEQGEPINIAYENQPLWTARKVVGTFRHNWRIGDYPFDRHRLDILIEDTVFDRRLFRYEPDGAQSGINPEIELPGWRITEFEIAEAPHHYATAFGDPTLTESSDYSQLRLSITLERTEYTGFIKLTVGLFAATIIALLAFFFDPNKPGFYTGKMGLLVGALFAVVINLRAADTVLGNTVEVTLVAALHILGAALILLMALITAWHQQRAERGRVLAYPNWPLIAAVSAGYALANLLLIARATT